MVPNLGLIPRHATHVRVSLIASFPIKDFSPNQQGHIGYSIFIAANQSQYIIDICY